MSICYYISYNNAGGIMMSKTASSKYMIIKNDIKRQIKSGKLRRNERVLSESQLCKKYNVSRITVVRAINDLVSEGYLYRIQGKGTFVESERIQEGVTQLSGFRQRMKDKDFTLKTKVINASSVEIPEKMSRYFSLPDNMQVICLKRLRIVNSEPLCISISYLVPEIFYWVILENMEEESLYDLLESKYHFELGESEQTIEVGYLKESDAKFLNISSKDPCLKLTLYTKLKDKRPAQFEETYYLGNRYAYKIHFGITEK